MTRNKTIGGVAGASVITAITLFVAPWEGKRNNAYLDIAGVPTICYGHTKGVRMGDTASDEQCNAWLRDEVVEFNKAIRQCLTREPSPEAEIALNDLAFNVGVNAVCNSTALKKYNAGDDQGACDALLLYDKVRVNGQLRVVGWQVKRRTAEQKLCKQGS